MELLPVIQTFFNKPVRFFKTEFEMDLYCRNDSTGLQKTVLKTWAIPLPDYCDAIGYGNEHILRIIERNKDVFDGFYRYESILDRASAQKRNTLLMAIEMCDGLNMKLHTTRIKDPEIREAVVRFQRWVLFAFNALRAGKLRPAHIFRKIEGILPDYGEALQLIGYDRGNKIKETYRKEGVSHSTGYRRTKLLNGGENLPTKKGKPKKSPSFKGKHKMPGEAQKIIDTFNANPGLTKKDIYKLSGTKYSYGHVNMILRGQKTVH